MPLQRCSPQQCLGCGCSCSFLERLWPQALSVEQVEASPPPSPKAAKQAGGRADSATRKPAKQKKPKAKKVTTAQVSAELDVAALQQLLATVEHKYAADERNQLEYVADHFLKTFAECDIPFNKTVLEQPLSKARHCLLICMCKCMVR